MTEPTRFTTGLSPAHVYSAEAAAPVMISTSSPVMTAWRVRLNRIWYLLIMSPAFLEAFWKRDVSCKIYVGLRMRGEKGEGRLTSMALRRAEISHAWPSARACVMVSTGSCGIIRYAYEELAYPVERVGERVFSEVG